MGATRPRARAKGRGRPGIRVRLRFPKARWKRAVLAVMAGVLAFAVGVLGFYYVQFSRIIEARLHGERDRVIPRVFARPLTLHTGQGLSERELVARLNDVGYTERARVERAGEFAVDGRSVVLVPRGGDHAGKPVRIAFAEPQGRKGRQGLAGPPPAPAPDRIARVEAAGKAVDERDARSADAVGPRHRARARSGGASRWRSSPRACRKPCWRSRTGASTRIRASIRSAWSARSSPTCSPIAAIRSGGSTITQQLARMFFLSAEFNAELQSRQRSYRRKVLEAFMALILETKATKDEILELYLNDVYLGNRGSFALHGVAEAAQIFFGKDVSNLTLSEAALIAGIIQNPVSALAVREQGAREGAARHRAVGDGRGRFHHARRRRLAPPASRLPWSPRAVDNEAPYFVDYLSDALETEIPGVMQRQGTLDVYTTLDLNLQRYAQEAVARRRRQGRSDSRRSASTKPAPAQAALIAMDPRTGEVLALVGGRFYNQSQFNRAIAARRQPGSTFKPFVYLAAFERAAEEGRSDLTPASMVSDEPTTWTYDEQEWSPRNYDGEYDGVITLRRALALSRNIATIKVAEQTGFEQRRVAVEEDQGRQDRPAGLPVDRARRLRAHAARSGDRLHRVCQRRRDQDSARHRAHPERRRDDRARSRRRAAHRARGHDVPRDQHDAQRDQRGHRRRRARRTGFALDAAGKSGTTNDLRDAWFVGFTPELLAVVWVGFDDNTPLGLSGTQAALPIWTEFMKRALAGHPNLGFEPPEGISFVEIDRDTGRLALPTCPRVTTEAFLAGTEPTEVCELHRW